MALHDWAILDGWEGVHHLWMSELLHDLKANLPPGYRAIIGASPLVSAPLLTSKPDVAVAAVTPKPAWSGDGHSGVPEPDYEVAISTVEEDLTLMVGRGSRVVAVVELISPGNKDRPAFRRKFGRHYENYLRNGVNLLLIDVHRRPAAFSFPHYLATALGVTAPALSAPAAVSYGLSFPLPTNGRMLDIWQRPLVVGQPLPAMTLMLSNNDYVSVNLDATYSRAAAGCYLE